MHCLKWCLYDNQVIRSTINIRVKGYGENSSYNAIFKTTADICSAHSSPINLTHSNYIYLIKKVSCVNYLMGDYESLTLIPIYTQSQITRYPTPGSECMRGSRGWTGGPDLSLKIHKKIIGFLSIRPTGPDHLKNHKASKPAFNDGLSSARERNAI